MAARLIAFILYLPAILAVGALVPRTVQIGMHGNPAGLYGFLYAGVVILLCLRAARVLKGLTIRPWVDVVLLAIVDGLLVFLALTSR
ncbi:MAG: hypothetical protein KGJ84_06825 [Elusimicrobia bacterium]|nr:hypothetical protein [Elusimicrobiota bacterium]